MTNAASQYSLWLLPTDATQLELAALIARLGVRFGTQPFMPHLTIQGDLSLSLDRVSHAAKSVAAHWPPQRWRVAEVAGSEHFFRSLYLRFDETPAYVGGKKYLQSASGSADGLSLFPHLSLAYGVPDEAQKREVIDELSSMIGNEITFDRVVVARSSKQVPIAEWACQAAFPFNGAQ